MKTTFSILMATYHADDPVFLGQAIDSILFQSVLPEQFILVVDGQVPAEIDTVLNLRQQSAESLRIEFIIIRLVHNSGLGVALQTGLEQATGEFVVRMDADDISESNRIEQAKNYLEANPNIDILGAQISEFQDKPGHSIGYRIVPKTHDEIVIKSKFRNPINHVTVVMKRAIVLEKGGYKDCLYFEDYFLWLRLLKSGCQFHNLDTVSVHVRIVNLENRRSGFAYAKHELNFALTCYQQGLFSFLNLVTFTMFRIPIRLFPKSLILRMYALLRKNIH